LLDLGEKEDNPASDNTNAHNITNNEDSDVNNNSSEESSSEEERKSLVEGRTRKKPPYLNDYVTNEEELEEEFNLASSAQVEDPLTYEEAVKSNKWKKVMEVEIEAIERNETWELSDLPKNTKKIRVKWVFKTKINEKGEIEKHKARLVSKGFYQQHGIDYREVFAPVARWDTIRTVIAVATLKGWSVFQLDVKSAFLHGDLNETVYVEQPPGFIKKGAEDKVYRLKKALYGLKQAPRACYSKIYSYFTNEGFTKSPSEYTLYVKKNCKGDLLIVSLYVDDMIFTGNNAQMFTEFKHQ